MRILCSVYAHVAEAFQPFQLLDGCANAVPDSFPLRRPTGLELGIVAAEGREDDYAGGVDCPGRTDFVGFVSGGRC